MSSKPTLTREQIDAFFFAVDYFAEWTEKHAKRRTTAAEKVDYQIIRDGVESMVLTYLDMVADQNKPMLAKHQPCGCVVCTCETDGDRCLGCGARHCDTHPVGQIPNPVYLPTPAPAKSKHMMKEKVG